MLEGNFFFFIKGWYALAVCTSGFWLDIVIIAVRLTLAAEV